MTYIDAPFLPGYDVRDITSHVNHWRTQAIANALGDLGFDVDVTNWESHDPPPASDYDAVIGQGPAFEISCRRRAPGCTKIYLGTTASLEQLIDAEEKRLEQLALRRGVQCRRRCYVRYAKDRGPVLADAVLLVGNAWTASTYTGATRAPIHRLPNVHADGIAQCLDGKDFDGARTHFLWMASYAAVLRGLDLLLELFAELPTHHLWICGHIGYERDLLDAYREELTNRPNIHFVGSVDVTGGRFAELTARCGYVIYPSGSEGTSGSVVNCMAAGLVPLVTLESGVDTGGHGRLIPSYTIEALRDVVLAAGAVDASALREEASAVLAYARSSYSKEVFLAALRLGLGAALEGSRAPERGSRVPITRSRVPTQVDS